MKWEWLRVGRRIEWLTGGLFLLSVLWFGLTSALSAHSLAVGILMGLFGGFISLMWLVPSYLLMLRRRRREEAGLLSKHRAPLGTRGRLKFYLLLVLLTLVSSEVQASHGMVSITGSVMAVYLWNLALVIVVITWNEFSIRFRSKRRTSADPFHNTR